MKGDAENIRRIKVFKLNGFIHQCHYTSTKIRDNIVIFYCINYIIVNDEKIRFKQIKFTMLEPEAEPSFM